MPPAPVGYWGIAFSHDGSRVFYATKSAKEPAGRLYVVNVLGGRPRALLDGIDSTITWSPGRRQFAFYRASFPERGSSALLVADADGGNPRVLASVRGQSFFVPGFFAAPSWSPDGARIAAAIRDARTGDAGLVTVDAASGKIDRFRSGSRTRRSRRGCPTDRGFCSSPIRWTRSENSRARCGCSRTRAESRTA